VQPRYTRMPVAYATQATCVAVVTVVWSACWLAGTYSLRRQLSPKSSKLALPLLSLLFSSLFILIATLLVRAYRTSGTPLVSPFSERWFSVGWNKSLVFMGVVCDSPVAYGLIINYQIARCIVGSLLANAFQPFLTTLQSKLTPREGLTDLRRLLLARACTDVYGFVSSLTDLILYVSQVDIFIISCVTTIVTNYGSTLLLLNDTDEDAHRQGEAELVSHLEKSQPQPLLSYGGALRLRL
jgi:hypothetical protein